MPRSAAASKNPKRCAKCDARVARPVLAAHEAELCAACAMSADPGAELAFREGSARRRSARRARCPHYACTTGGGMGYCDNCSGEDY